ncbi:MAG: glycosyltransferase family protein [Muribaculaceae bacterium]|jgi:hypothetical protein|nr:glycosyltransferase family protein [Muribaculaceae bacterium]
MFSIICCSINNSLLSALENNIAETIGCEYEFIPFDNSKQKKGICEVYNICAENAKGEYLLFIHEDAHFDSSDWGQVFSAKLDEPRCGAIGFAGSTVRIDMVGPWGCGHSNKRANYTEVSSAGEVVNYRNPHNKDFSHVVVLDGFCIAVRRDVWQEVHFDEETFKGFHCYDIDYSLMLVYAHKHNYVCNTVKIRHLSSGSYGASWYRQSQILRHKWQRRMPVSIHHLTHSQLSHLRKVTRYSEIKFVISHHLTGSPFTMAGEYFRHYPFTFRSFKLLAECFAHQRSYENDDN